MHINMSLSNTSNQNRDIFASFMNRKFYSALFSIFLAAILLSGASVHSLSIGSTSQNYNSISQSSVADQIAANTICPLFAEHNFSGLQLIIIHPVRSIQKNVTAFLRNIEKQFSIQWKQATLRAITLELSLSVSKIIFPSHFFW